MRKNTLLALVAMAVMMPPISAGAETVIGYSNGNQGRSTTFGTETERTGLAVKFTGEKLMLLKGRSITGLQASVGTSRSTEGKISMFVATSLDGPRMVEQEFDIVKANSWEGYTFTSPYVISGEEEAIYIGYEMKTGRTQEALSADRSVQMPEVTYALYGDEWTDVYEKGVGQGNVRMMLDEDPEITDLLCKPLAFNGFYKAGQAYGFSGQVLNFGTVAVNGFDIVLKIGDSPAERFAVNETLAPGGSYDFKLPDYAVEQSGGLDISVSIENQGGVADADAADNIVSTTAYFYPADMERAILVEGFTGQACSNCPAGHRALDSALETWRSGAGNSEVVEVMHHSGYLPDYFTMAEDIDYLTLYSGNTYAPAFTVNRKANVTNGNPVFEAGSSMLLNSLAGADASKPYVSLSVSNQYDPVTRELKVLVDAYTHEAIPSEVKTLNVLLCQNNIVSRQTGGGSEYQHNCVFRGSLTGNAWGVTKECLPGTNEILELTTTIPEVIHSSYWTDDMLADYSDEQRACYDIPVVVEDLYLVVYAGTYHDTNSSKRNVLNCVQMRLGESVEQDGFCGVSAEVVSAGQEPEVFVDNGIVSVSTDCRAIEIYNLAGMQVANGNLARGVYLVRVVTASGDVFVKKILNR